MSKRRNNTRVAVGYIRASKDSQKLTPEVQRGAMEKWALEQGVSIVSWHVDQDVCSVTPIDQRRGLTAAMAALKEFNAGIFLVAKRDRLARSPALMETIELAIGACGGRLMSADGSSSVSGVEGIIVRGFNDLFAQIERERIRERTTSALALKKSRGERVGGIPYGKSLSEDGVHLVDNPEEIRVITRARALSSRLSLGKIAKKLHEEGFRSRKGGVFFPAQIQRMLHTA